MEFFGRHPMATTTGHRAPIDTADFTSFFDLDACGVPCSAVSAEREPPTDSPLPGLDPGAVMAEVQRVQLPRPERALVWGSTNGRTILFDVDERMGLELQAALEEGDEPIAIIAPEQIIAAELELVR